MSESTEDLPVSDSVINDTGESTEQQDWHMAQALAEQAEQGSAEMALTGQPVAVPLDVVMTPMVFGLFSIIAPNWRVSEGECSALTKSWADVIEHYFPDATMSPGVAVIVGAVGTTGAVIGTRVMQGIPRIVEGEN